MTCLLIQECPRVLRLGAEELERAQSYVRATRETRGWRYLPDLPCDLDDTVMAWAALDPAYRGISSKFVEYVMTVANEDGGFPTFLGENDKSQASHPAVTLNVAFAFDQAGVWWPCAAADRYLDRWLRQTDFPACPWMGSRLFPIYLFSRATRLVDRLGVAAGKRLATRVLDLRRADGTWGGELPDSLDTALAVLALDKLGWTVSSADNVERFLLDSQFGDGGWGWSPIYSDGSGTWFGHRAITTVFAISAVETLRHAVRKHE